MGLFKVNVQIWKMFLGSLKFEYVLGMPDIPYILGVKSRCWVQCQALVFRKLESIQNMVRHT